MGIRNLEECDIALAELEGSDEVGPPPCSLRTLMEKRTAEGTLVTKDKIKWPESEVSRQPRCPLATTPLPAPPTLLLFDPLRCIPMSIQNFFIVASCNLFGHIQEEKEEMKKEEGPAHKRPQVWARKPCRKKRKI